MNVAQHFSPRFHNQWLPLASQQLRLRNLIQILAFSIKNNKKETAGSKSFESGENNYLVNVSYYFTLHATAMSAPFYTSEKLKSDSPKWKELEMSCWKGNVCSSVDAIVIRLWLNNPQEPEDKVLAVWGVYLSGLQYLGQNLGADIPLKPNSLVFLMTGGYFTDPNCIESCVKIRYKTVMINKCDVRTSYSVNTLSRLQTLQQVIKKEEVEVELLKKKISLGDFFQSENRGRVTLRKLLSRHKPKTNHADILKIKGNIEIAKYRVNTLKDEKTILLERLKKLQKHIESVYNGNQVVESKIMENYRILRKEVQNHKDWKRSYIDRREKYLHSKAMLNFRTKQLISELNIIYPIVEISTDKFTICGVHLPNSEDFSGHDDLQISVALGFVTHVIQMISIFLQIPLRYPIIHYGSRSRIIDQITDKIPDSEREFCLFVKGKDKLQFHYAVYLLNKNIAQMRWLCGLPTSDLRNTLENLSSLLKLKFGNFGLDHNTRSLSPSTVDFNSSTISVSSPLESVISFHSKRYTRMHYVSESGINSYNKMTIPTRNLALKSVDSSKNILKNVVSIKNKDSNCDIKKVNCALSFSLDKGLDEYQEITSVKEKGNSQYGSEPVLNYSIQNQQSKARVNFLKSWNIDSERPLFSDDDFEIFDHFNKNPNISSVDNTYKNTFKECHISCDIKKSPCNLGFELCTDPLKTDSEILAETKNDMSKSSCSVNEEQCQQNFCTQLKTLTSDVKKFGSGDNLMATDSLLENVTSRTEALANQITCFNRFRNRFKSTLESSN